MISGLSIFFMCISILLSMGLPIFLVVYYKKNEDISLKYVFFGVLTFIFFQVLTRIPLLTYIGKQPFYQELSKNIVVLAFVLGLTAALFEEVGRFLVFKLFLKNNRLWKNGVAFGIGHGGIEAMLIVGMKYINQVVVSVLLNQGGVEQVSATTGLPIDSLSQIQNTLISTQSYLFLVAGLERVFAVLLHVALSIMVLYAIKSKKLRFFWLAILVHTLVDMAVVLLANYSIWFAEGAMLLVALGSILYMHKMKWPYRDLDRIIPISKTIKEN